MTHSPAELRCLRAAPPRSLGIAAAHRYLTAKRALHKLQTPIPVLRPQPPRIRLTVPRWLVWRPRGVSDFH